MTLTKYLNQLNQLFSFVLSTMAHLKCLVAFLLIFTTATISIEAIEILKPSVLICTLIRNKAHVLPYFFSYLENLNYPKDRIGLWIRSDHNEDRSLEVIDKWLSENQDRYLNVNKKYKCPVGRRPQERSITDWPYQRLSSVMTLKQEGLEFARNSWYDYVFFIDADVLLINPNTLSDLIESNLPVVSPLLASEGDYSNFIDKIDGYEKVKTDKFDAVVSGKTQGATEVDFVSNVVLIDLNLVKSDYLTFDRKAINTIPNRGNFIYDGPLDNELIFAQSANLSGKELL